MRFRSSNDRHNAKILARIDDVIQAIHALPPDVQPSASFVEGTRLGLLAFAERPSPGHEPDGSASESSGATKSLDFGSV